MSAATRAARPGVLAAVSEWAVDEVCVGLSMSRQPAQTLLEHGLLLTDRLPATLQALESGTLHTGHVSTFVHQVAVIGDPGVRAAVEADLLRWIAGRVTTPAQLSQRAARVVLRLDASAAARKLEQALRSRGVYLAAGREPGMEQLTAVLTTGEARAAMQVLGAYADALNDPPADAEPGAEGRPAPVRSRAQTLADVLMDLILRPGADDRPPVQVTLTLVASIETLLGGDGPGEVAGQVVPAEMVRHLARSLGLVPDTGASDTDTADRADEATGDRASTPRESTPRESAEAPTQVISKGNSAGDPVDACAAATAAGEPRDHPYPDSAPAPVDGCSPDWMPEPGTASPARGSEQDRQLLEALWAEEQKPAHQQRWPIREQLPPDAADIDLPDVDDHQGWATLWAYWRAQQLTATHGADSGPPPGGGALPGWACADAAVQAASTLLLQAQQQLSRARHHVDAAETRARLTESRSLAGQLDQARTTIAALSLVGGDQRADIGHLLTRTGGGGLTDRPHLALTDALTGTLTALTDARELRRHAHCGRDACTRRRTTCTHDLTHRPGLTPPPPTDSYRPTADLDRYIRTRDRRCRFPGCRQPVPANGHLDHTISHQAGGATSTGNLAGLCITHHRSKHQAPGWNYTLQPDGRLTVTTPTGLSTTTDPPPF